MIAILAPYDRSENTLAALRVADLAVAAGYDVYYLVSGSKGSNIHRYWDTHAISGNSKGKLLKLLPAKFRHIITFGMLPLHNWRCIPKLGLVDKTVWYDCVLSPYEMVRSETVEWNAAHRLIAPSDATHRLAMSAGYISQVKPNTITKLHWSTGDDSMPTEFEAVTRFAAICDSGCLREFPEIWLHTVDQFLNHTDSLTVDCYFTCSVPRRARSVVKALKDKHGNRFTVHRPMCIQDFLVWLRDRDIAVYPSCRTVIGMYPAICKSIRMPLIAADISPINEITPDGIHSTLVKLPKYSEPCGVERAQFDTTQWLRTWLDVANNPHSLLDRTETAEKLRAKTENYFVEFWKSSWQAILA